MSVDPRIGLELEKLNNSCEKINNLEVNLGKIRNCLSYPRKFYLIYFRRLIFRWTQKKLQGAAGDGSGRDQNNQQ